jgi:hypothetical protein
MAALAQQMRQALGQTLALAQWQRKTLVHQDLFYPLMQRQSPL